MCFKGIEARQRDTVHIMLKGAQGGFENGIGGGG